MYNKNVRYGSSYSEYVNKIKFKEDIKIVTIVVGIKYKDGIVLASDSQSIIGDNRAKETEVKKIKEFPKIYNNLFFNFGGSGEKPLLKRAEEELIERCKNNIKITKLRDYADICEDVVDFMANRYVIKKYIKLGILKVDDLDDEINLPKWRKESASLKYDFLSAVLIKNGNKDEFELYRVTPEGFAEPIEKYSYVGSGWGFAQYLLSSLYTKNIGMVEAINIGLTTIKEVKKIEPNCGGDTEISILTKSGFLPNKKKIEFIKNFENNISPYLKNELKKIKNYMKVFKENNKNQLI